MSIAEKLTAIAENEQRVYETGYNKGRQDGGFDWSAFWDRTSFQNAFWRWKEACYSPPADYVITGSIRQAFVASTITDTLIPINGAGDCAYAFQSCNQLVTIPSLDLTDATDVSKMFYGCSLLANIGFKGVIKINGIDVSFCTKLDKATLLSLLNCLEEKTDGGEWIVTLGTANKSKLTEAELKIAEDKGWEVK